MKEVVLQTKSRWLRRPEFFSLPRTDRRMEAILPAITTDCEMKQDFVAVHVSEK